MAPLKMNAPQTTPEATATEPEQPHKAFSRMRAQAAFAAGISVYELAGGGFLASRWNWPPRELPDLGALAAFLRRQGVQI